VPPGEGTIELSELRIVGANTARPSVELTDQQKTILGPEVTRGLALSVLLAVGTEFREPLSIRFGGADDASEDDTPPSTEGKLLAFAGDVPAAPQATWITIQRAFGPVQFERVGFAFTEQAELALLLDGSVSLAGLTIVLVGLEAAMPLKAPYEPAFGLAGLQVSFEGGGVEIAGGLEKIPGREPAAYTGDLIVKAAGFGLTALGSYTTVGGDPSLFAFLFLDAPLGGPPFFFVTGVAGGFGYNRSLALPGIEGVADFPLVAGATGKLDAKQTQQQLDERIVPALGQNWLAAGVRFTSFEMVSSFALLTIAFGTHTEIALLGEATISVPAAALGEEVTPTAEAQMVLLVDVDPDSGQLAVSAQLTPNSYVLSRAAKLTGGFGFYTWFGKSPHAGDFVITLGGYNPYFTAPDHYPKPPRLGLDWKLPGNLEIKGGLYFALTPSVVMAGGSLEATWTSGSLRAWFDAQADFLIRFKPFSYRIDVKISIGVSLTLDFGFTTKVITVHVGVELSLYGPPFGGVATIDLWIVSFTIEFGGEPLPAPDLSWTQFRQSFLPAVGVVTLAAAQGLLGRHEEVWLVDPAHLRIEVATQVPPTDASVNRVQPAGDWNRQLGIGPMGAKPGTLAGALEITLERTEGEQDSWHASAVTGKAPAGLWHNTTNVMDGPALVEDVMKGVAVVPAPPEGGHTRPVPLAALAAADPAVRACRWSAATAPHGDSFDQDRALAVLGETLADPAVAATRDALLAALRAQGLTTAESVDVGDLAAGAGDVLTDPPQLRSLGEVVPG
jgi:hypothetical protein